MRRLNIGGVWIQDPGIARLRWPTVERHRPIGRPRNASSTGPPSSRRLQELIRRAVPHRKTLRFARRMHPEFPPLTPPRENDMVLPLPSHADKKRKPGNPPAPGHPDDLRSCALTTRGELRMQAANADADSAGTYRGENQEPGNVKLLTPRKTGRAAVGR